MSPSTAHEKSLPKELELTFEGVNANSLVFVPSRARLLWYVLTPAKSVTPIVAEADFVLSALLVAVIVNDPTVVEENVAAVNDCVENDPPLFVHVTPAPPTSFVTVAVNGKLCAVVIPPRLGLIVTLMLPAAEVEVVAVFE
jgi:hypothetical protein